MTEASGSRVFVSYRRVSPDRLVAESIVAGLRRAGHCARWDEDLPPGEALEPAIAAEIKSSDRVAVVLSEEALSPRTTDGQAHAPWVEHELTAAMANGVPILAVLLDGYAFSGWESVWRTTFEKTRHIDLHEPHLESERERAVNEILGWLASAEAQAPDPLLEYRLRLRRRVELLDLSPLSPELAQVPWRDFYVDPLVRKRSTRTAVADHGAAAGMTHEDDAPIEVDLCLLRHPRCVIVGEPGSGKSLLLRRIASALLADGIGRLPILARLADLAARQAPGRSSLLDMICALEPETSDAERAAVRRAVTSGRAVLLLDGIDEIPGTASDRSAALERVRDFLGAHPECPAVLTSRPTGYVAIGPTVPTFRLEPWDNQRVHDFALRFASALGVPRSDAEELANEIASYRFQSRIPIVSSPLLLSLIVRVGLETGEIVGQPVALYEQVIRLLLREWRASRGRRQLERRVDDRVLRNAAQTVAIALQERTDHRASREYLADVVLAPVAFANTAEGIVDALLGSGLLVERGLGELGFWHRSFGEYLAGLAIARAGDVAAVLKRLCGVLDIPDRRELVRFAVPVLEIVDGRRSEAKAVLNWFLQSPDGPDILTYLRRAQLLVTCLEEGSTPDPELWRPVLVQLNLLAVLFPFEPMQDALWRLTSLVRGRPADALECKGAVLLVRSEFPNLRIAALRRVIESPDSGAWQQGVAAWAGRRGRKRSLEHGLHALLCLMANVDSADALDELGKFRQEHHPELFDAIARCLPQVDQLRALLLEHLEVVEAEQAATSAWLWRLAGLPLHPLVERVQPALSSGPKAGFAAASLLSEAGCGPEAWDADVRRHLANPNPLIRRQAAQLLVASGAQDDTAVEQLVEDLRASVQHMRFGSALSLLKAGLAAPLPEETLRALAADDLFGRHSIETLAEAGFRDTALVEADWMRANPQLLAPEPLQEGEHPLVDEVLLASHRAGVGSYLRYEAIYRVARQRGSAVAAFLPTLKSGHREAVGVVQHYLRLLLAAEGESGGPVRAVVDEWLSGPPRVRCRLLEFVSTDHLVQVASPCLDDGSTCVAAARALAAEGISSSVFSPAIGALVGAGDPRAIEFAAEVLGDDSEAVIAGLRAALTDVQEGPAERSAILLARLGHSNVVHEVAGGVALRRRLMLLKVVEPGRFRNEAAATVAQGEEWIDGLELLEAAGEHETAIESLVRRLSRTASADTSFRFGRRSDEVSDLLIPRPGRDPLARWALFRLVWQQRGYESAGLEVDERGTWKPLRRYLQRHMIPLSGEVVTVGGSP